MKITHLTTCHKFDDHRIFFKHSITQKSLGHNVRIFAFDTSIDGQFRKNGIEVNILKSKKSLSKLSRLYRAIKLINSSLKNKQDLIILHEPELLLFCPAIRLFSRTKIIFDMHEDYPLLIKSRIEHKLIGYFAEFFVRIYINFFQTFVNNSFAVTKEILMKYCNNDSLYVPNLPKISIQPYPNKFLDLYPLKIAYVGVIGSEKGADLINLLCHEIAKQKLDFEIHLCGTPTFSSKFRDIDFHEITQNKFVHYYGELNSNEMQEVLSNCHIGLCFLKDNPHHNISMPAKVFEYVGQRLFVLFSNNIRLNDLVSRGLAKSSEYSLQSLTANLLELQRKDFSNFDKYNISSYVFDSIVNDYQKHLVKLKYK